MPAGAERRQTSLASGLASGSGALLDMLAATLRGGTKAVLGLPGDIESLGRAGINAAGGNVGTDTLLPTAEDMGRKLPPLELLQPMPSGKAHPYETLGEFAPVPGVVEAGIKGAQLAKALRSTPTTAAPVVDASRRAFLGNTGKLAAGASAATAAGAPGLLSKVLREGSAAAPAAKVAARVGAGALARAAAFAASAKYHNMYMGGFKPSEVLPHLEQAFPKATDAQIAKMVENLAEARFGNPAGTLDWPELGEMGIRDQDSLIEAVATGRLDSNKLHPDVFPELSGGDSPLSRAAEGTRGWADAYDLLEGMSPSEITEYVKNINAAHKAAGTKSPFDQPNHALYVKELLESR